MSNDMWQWLAVGAIVAAAVIIAIVKSSKPTQGCNCGKGDCPLRDKCRRN